MVPRHQTEVIVVGAGLAGLTAALELMSHQVSFVLLEARDRVGGRVYSRAEDGVVVDYGAQWVSSKQTRMSALLHRFGLTTTPTHTEGRTFYELMGRRRTSASAMPPLPAVSLLDVLRLRKRLRELERRIDLEAPWMSKEAEQWDAGTLRAWLDRTMFSKYGKALYEIIAEEALCGELGEFSLLDAVWSSASCGGHDRILTAEQRWIAEGAQTLPERMAAALGDAVKLNAPARAVEWTERSVTVRTDREAWEGKRAILAMPPTFAGRLRYDPPLPYMRDQLTQRAGQGAVMKFIVVFEKAFWRDVGLSGEAYMDQGPIRLAMDSTLPGQGKGVLTALATGKSARTLGLLPEEERRAAVLRSLSVPFGDEALRPVAFYEKDWMSDPWSRGGYAAHLPPGVLTQLGPALLQPVGPIHWAGTETATEWRSYMEGAVQSGERAAAEVLRAIRP
ncbi:FAD-dependent oxidoreductase [Paenibacillus sp.]|uniref:flavin monoamine oxidase family protein n=1 Tax=Paenibacillus sp. TaxID=58172 RepID=UPI0028115C2E|nr:FAD-dependent oxidoreductase [Paenibacillus sp.]